MNRPSQRDREIFENLFVLEAANNHWGDLERGKKIVNDYGRVVRYNSVKAAIKFQFRDVDNFIHDDFKGNKDIRYIKQDRGHQAVEGELQDPCRRGQTCRLHSDGHALRRDFGRPLRRARFPDHQGGEFGLQRLATVGKIASTRRPTIISSGGANEKALDDVVKFFEHRAIPLAINHCVSLYPSEDYQLELNQIDYLRSRYDDHVIGLSTHEYHDWHSSMLISYAKGARTWERHIDIEYDEVPVSSYCSLPEQVDVWFKAFRKAEEMCGGSSESRRILPKEEIQYLDALVRGVYAKRDLEAGYEFNSATFSDDFYLAVPLRKGQLSCREILNGQKLTEAIKDREPLTIEHVDGPYAESDYLRQFILDRGF